MLHLTIVNLDPDRPAPVAVVIAGIAGRAALAEMLTAKRIDTKTKFGRPDSFVPKPLAEVRVTETDWY